jgi:hypothetical protein
MRVAAWQTPPPPPRAALPHLAPLGRAGHVEGDDVLHAGAGEQLHEFVGVTQG